MHLILKLLILDQTVPTSCTKPPCNCQLTSAKLLSAQPPLKANPQPFNAQTLHRFHCNPSPRRSTPPGQRWPRPLSAPRLCRAFAPPTAEAGPARATKPSCITNFFSVSPPLRQPTPPVHQHPPPAAAAAATANHQPCPSRCTRLSAT